MKWFRILFDHAITHCMPEPLRDAIVAEMVAREHPVIDVATTYGPSYVETFGGNPREVTEWGIDLGGSTFLDCPMETFELEGLRMKIASEHLAAVSQMLHRDCPPRVVDGLPYRKLKAWHHAFVMRPVDHEALCELVTARLPEASERSAAFMASIGRGLGN